MMSLRVTSLSYVLKINFHEINPNVKQNVLHNMIFCKKILFYFFVTVVTREFRIDGIAFDDVCGNNSVVDKKDCWKVGIADGPFHHLRNPHHLEYFWAYMLCYIYVPMLDTFFNKFQKFVHFLWD